MKTEQFQSPDEKSVVIAAYAANSSMSSRHMPCIALKGIIIILTKLCHDNTHKLQKHFNPSMH